MKPISRQSNAGFTMMELIVIIAIIGILSAIATPNLLAILTRQRLNSAQAEVVTAIREAQAKAKQQKRDWRVCFQEDGTKVRWFVQPAPDGSNCSTNPGPWNDLISSDANKVEIDSASTLNKSGNFYRVQFEKNGWVQGTSTDPEKDIGKIIFKTRNQNGGSKRCVALATLLGTIRTASDKDCEG